METRQGLLLFEVVGSITLRYQEDSLKQHQRKAWRGKNPQRNLMLNHGRNLGILKDFQGCRTGLHVQCTCSCAVNSLHTARGVSEGLVQWRGKYVTETKGPERMWEGGAWTWTRKKRKDQRACESEERGGGEGGGVYSTLMESVAFPRVGWTLVYNLCCFVGLSTQGWRTTLSVMWAYSVALVWLAWFVSKRLVNERLRAKAEGSTRLAYTGLHGALERCRRGEETREVWELWVCEKK